MPTARAVAAIVPPTGAYVREDRCQTPLEKFRTIAARPPIDLMYAAAAFEGEGCRCTLVDYPAAGLDCTRFERDLLERRPDVLVASVTTQTIEEDMAVLARAKRLLPSLLTIAKGAHFNVLDRDVMARHRGLDVALRGETEPACVELARGLPLENIAGITWRDGDGRIRRNPDRPFGRDLDAIAFPARHLTDNGLYRRPDTGEPQTTLVTNRGCPFHCSYCLANQVAGTLNRYRSVENVIAEIKQCVERHGIRNFLLRSDLFTQNAPWVHRLCEAILDERLDVAWACNSRVDTVEPRLLAAMKRAGCWIMAFGVESGDQRTLDRVDKRARVDDAFRAVAMCRHAGIKSSVYLLLGLPWDDADSLERQVEFARRLDPDIVEFFYPYPFPGTPLYDQCVELGLVAEGEIPRQSYSEPAFRTLHLSIDELRGYRNKALRGFYLRPSQVVRTLRGVRSAAELRGYVSVGLSQLRALAG